jgi:hypothetical protein
VTTSVEVGSFAFIISSFLSFSGHILGERRTLLSSCQRCVRDMTTLIQLHKILGRSSSMTT